MNEKLRLFLGYVLFGGIAALVDLGGLYILTEFAGINYLISAVFSYIGGMITNYSLNKVFNFKNKSKKIAKQFGLFTLVALIGLGLNQLILWILVELAGIWYIWAKIISISLIMVWNFFGHKKLTFGLIK
ncbi:MAG: GtrA family protein [Nanoarchaeota archaeon]|nr:GtrA family protein [Nanoarchaeota archaeon]